jgi:hypothetical protein
MYYPNVADPSQEYATAFVRGAERELHATKRLRALPHYRDHVVVAESWTPAGEYTLLRYPAVPLAPPNARGLLDALRLLQKARLVHGAIGLSAVRGGRLCDFRVAVDMARAVPCALEYFFPDADAPDKRMLGILVQGAAVPVPAAYTRFLEMPREAAILELLKGWRTWDLYDLSGVVDHPLAARCRAERVEDRPTVEACLAAL